MRIKEEFNKSYTKKLLTFLFNDDYNFDFSESIIGSLLARVSIPTLSCAFTFLGIFLFWYEGLVSKYIPIISKGWLPSLIILLALFFADKKYLKLKKFHLWYLGFLLLLAVSAIPAVLFGVPKLLLISGWILFAQFFFAILLGQTLKRERVLPGLVFIGLPAAIYGIYQFLSNTPTPAVWLSSFEKVGTRAFSFFGSPNVLGVLASTLAIISFALFLKNKKWLYVACSFAYGLAMVFTLSREAWFGFLVAALIFIFFWQRKWLYFSPFLALTLIISRIRDRIFAVFSANYWLDSYLDGRIWSFINGWYLVLKRPFLGWGPGSYGGQLAASYASPVYLESIQNGYTALYFADNQFIEVLVQSGFLGLLTLIGFIISAMVNLTRKNDILNIGILAAFIGFWSSGLFANILEFGAVSVLIGILIGACNVD